MDTWWQEVALTIPWPDACEMVSLCVDGFDNVWDVPKPNWRSLDAVRPVAFLMDASEGNTSSVNMRGIVHIALRGGFSVSFLEEWNVDHEKWIPVWHVFRLYSLGTSWLISQTAHGAGMRTTPSPPPHWTPTFCRKLNQEKKYCLSSWSNLSRQDTPLFEGTLLGCVLGSYNF